VSLRSRVGAVRREGLRSLYKRIIVAQNRAPLVSFSFDDFPRTAYSSGGAILEKYGVRGTYYTAWGLKNTANELGEQFRSEDVDALLEKGHELASHTFNHISSRAVSYAAFRDDVEKGRKMIAEAAGADTGNFAYPFGDVTFEAKRRLSPGLTSARGIFGGLNGPEIDLNLLRANSLYGGLKGMAGVEELIRENTARKSWLIFYTHDVRENPSAYGCTPALFAAAVDCAVRSGGALVLTVQEALTEVGVQNGSPKVQARCGVAV
jgi:peptidoglycan/xylan/chitin deacetylase (PgdA/CDA1 family)